MTPGYQRVACDQDKFQAGVRRVIVLRLLREGEVGIKLLVYFFSLSRGGYTHIQFPRGHQGHSLRNRDGLHRNKRKANVHEESYVWYPIAFTGF